MTRLRHCAVLAAMHCAPSIPCLAQDTADERIEDPVQPEPSGILPLPDYAGDLWSRSYLTGDWGGARSRLAERGVQLELNWTQTFQSVEDGGLDEGGRYGGSPDLLLNLDLQRMGVLPGAALTVRAESRYGESINARTGMILPANTDATVPVTDEPDEDTIALTNVYYTQFLTETFGVLLGKWDNLESDFNEFASGRGTTQFLNANFVFTPVALYEPYSTIGTAAIWVPNERFLLWGGLANTTDASTTSGFSDVGDGTSAFAEAYFQHSINGLPGGGSLGAIYEFDNEFLELDSPFLSGGAAGAALAPKTTDDTWAVYSSVWQYLWTESPAEGVVDVQNHEIDLQGVGMFLRGGTADQDVSPVEWTVSGGISGRGLFPSRDDDTFGVGYFYTSVQSTRFLSALDIDDRTEGLEVYYGLAVTPSTRLTLDVQVLDSAIPDTDAAVVLGLRLRTSF